ncbi:MAG: MFS transporter [Deltaproteobacteria bacterium]|jgi:MFS family permease|nr:MFS transporter [Deltaproteobacteria bacterium]MBT4269400.1 MFS transporter [Deltaproteobacteria bacterium]MBT4644813.1 MFS transporter [Deltaproteobacteria bacterium]MBT6498297.1 MFS transporter [Deltaproteobacteria bacterium]MBT7155270.1 MFS transporter [Deltaproteobacteria bacterium]
MNKIELDVAPDGKKGIFYGWIMVTGVFFMVAISCGSFYSFGVFFVPIMKEFEWSRSVLSGVLFVSGITYAASVPLIGAMADRFGYKWVSIVTAMMMGVGYILGARAQTVWEMYIFIGLLQGIGACAAIPLPLSMIANWFVKRQGLALGIASAGIGTGAAIVPLLVTFTETQFGWRTAMTVLGLLIMLIYVSIALLVIRRPDTRYIASYEGQPQVELEQTKAGADPDISLFQALTTRHFWSLFTIFGFCIFCVGLIITHLVPFARDTGLSPMSAASLLTIMGLCSIVGRLTAGFFSDRIGANRVLFSGLLLQGIMILWLSQMSSLKMFYLFAALFGVAYGGNLVMVPRLTATIFGVKSMGAIFGGLSVADGIGFALGPLLAGYLFDISGTYNDAFLITAAGIFIAVGVTFFLRKKG